MANILIVDDSASMRQMIKFTLEVENHKITEARDGKEGLKHASEHKYDLVITDVNMPEMNGIELTAQIRELANYKSIPVLLLTTESAGDKKKEGKNAGATGWLIKPFDPTKLVQVVTKVLR